MQLRWTKKALQQLSDAQDYIAQENPQAARDVAQRISDATYLLLTQPSMGRPGRIVGTYEWVVRKTPYLIAYTVDAKHLTIVRVIHSKQTWPLNIPH